MVGPFFVDAQPIVMNETEWFGIHAAGIGSLVVVSAGIDSLRSLLPEASKVKTNAPAD